MKRSRGNGASNGGATAPDKHARQSSANGDSGGSNNSAPDRLAEPIAHDQPPRLAFPVVGIGASAGGLEAFMEFFGAMSSDSGMAFVVIQHLPPDRDSMLVEILSQITAMAVREVHDGDEVQPNYVYVIRPGRTLTIKNGALHLGEPLEKRGHRHPVDDFFRSLAEEQRERSICVVMSGMGSNGSAGAQSIKAVGGVCIAQEPESAKFSAMPRNLIDSGYADFVLKPAEIPELLERYSRHPYASGAWDVETRLRSDRQVLAEILAAIRSRVRHDFSGYKKPTVLRRIERRMGLHQIVAISDYARLLRQNPSEMTALSDDLMIHVTGFFRDPEVWDALKAHVINPLVESRETGSIRAWVTACSSGEEAYTLAMLLVEALERANRELDIKIFATDTAERTLSQARSGVYPAGIESELSSTRLDRFFDRDDSLYRVKKELREMVVFAPQNLLQDPPFSRLDICTCRNLLIYLEPDTQRRALELLHFGLREGGALLLGTSENVSDSEELFQPIDKKHRIFRRIGPTRHGSVDFPLLQSQALAQAEQAARPRLRASIALLTNKALLDRYTPPSVVVDREQRILYFHGATERYLDQPRGEPTRDLLTLARESVRATLRAAVQQAVTQNDKARVNDGWTRADDGRRSRTVVEVIPLDKQERSPNFLVTFTEEFEVEVPSGSTPADSSFRDMASELQRVRDELENTIQELHASNEDMKASHEEATSINEEMQSTNEELETSKEELQSLNEELVTVNTQLQLKMEELEASTNDLSSLLSSTNIAVVFLDTHFRIRRFTPAVRDLMELIPADIGRPVSDLARKFADENLLHDATSVLTTLIPMEREVQSDAGNTYMRRVLPYRTADDRIEGVVVTFVDITERSRAVSALRESEEQYRLILEALKEYGIFMLDAEGIVVTWTAGAERLLLYNTSEAIGLHFGAFLPQDGQAGEHANAEIQSAIINGSITEEGWHVRRGGEQFWGSGMLAALRDSRGQLIGFVKVLRDNTERKLGEEALKLAKRAAESANDAKDRFLANVSHELRTPLSAILLWTSLVQDQENVAPEQLIAAMAAINRSAEEQRELIEDLVDTSRIAAGKLTLAVKHLHLPTIVESALESVRSTATAKGVALLVHIDPAVDGVDADSARLQQVVSNLAGNAVKFTPAGGTVRVSLVRRDDEVKFVVTDTGVGLAPEFLPHVFDRFAQVRHATARATDGLGLGLAIVKQIVELHGGSVLATSDGVGKGSTFEVRLPLPSVPAPVMPRVRIRKGQLHGLLHNACVLLIEDVTETRIALEATLREAGATVTMVDSAAAAFDSFRQNRPDIILSDLGLPDIDGYEFIRQVRAIEQSMDIERVPAIALTAFAGDNVHGKAIESGFQLCLTKPIQPRALVDAMLTQWQPEASSNQ